MQKSMETLGKELATVRTGKANPHILDSVKVDYYGQPVPLQQVASIAVPEARLITIQPWEKPMVAEIEKAIMAAELGLNPQSDGTMIRLPIPPLTEERRKDLVKVVKKFAEEARVAVRNIRRHGNEELKKAEKAHSISEDEMHTRQDEIQKLTDKFVKDIDEVATTKEKEIMEI